MWLYTPYMKSQPISQHTNLCFKLFTYHSATWHSGYIGSRSDGWEQDPFRILEGSLGTNAGILFLADLEWPAKFPNEEVWHQQRKCSPKLLELVAPVYKGKYGIFKIAKIHENEMYDDFFFRIHCISIIVCFFMNCAMRTSQLKHYDLLYLYL